MNKSKIEAAKNAALEVLLNNCSGTPHGLPRTAAWGYPEPYTRDLMISALGILASGHAELIEALRKTLIAAAQNQSQLGQIPGLVNNPEDRGSSDTTPLFLFALALFRKVTNEPNFLPDAAEKALTWMAYQSPDDRILVAQQPTSDWRDEQWVLGYGLYVNTIIYCYLRLLGLDKQADTLRHRMNQSVMVNGEKPAHVPEGFVFSDKPYYAMWTYKVLYSDRFDLLGNCLAILSGIAEPETGRAIIDWVEEQCKQLRQESLLAVDLPPCLLPYIMPQDPDWMPRDELYNQPGAYHNGGIWPFICGFYIAALVRVGYIGLAQEKLEILTDLVCHTKDAQVEFGFNEWFQAQTGLAQGQDWQTWSAAMYLYTTDAVEKNQPTFFDIA